MLARAEAEFGDMPLAALDDPRVRKDFLDWREKIARRSGEREADNRLSAISAMLTWAVDRGKLVANHLRGFKRIYHADRSEIIWLPEHIAAFMSVAPIEMQRALILGLHTGQREGDLLRLPRSSYDGIRISLRQGKARRDGRLAPLVEIPCTGALRRMLDGMERVSPLVLTNQDRSVIQETLLRPTLGPGNGEGWSTIGNASRIRSAGRATLSRSSRDGGHLAFGAWLHAATGRDDYRALASNSAPHP
jgi:integrase